jgi:hypothetical protein
MKAPDIPELPISISEGPMAKLFAALSLGWRLPPTPSP